MHVQALFCFQVYHLEDIVEQTGYILEKDSEYSQKILEEEEEEVSISVTQKGGRTLQHQVGRLVLGNKFQKISVIWVSKKKTKQYHTAG